MKYNPLKIEKKWQKYWEAKKLNVIKDNADGRKNFMLLAEFPYTSGNLHMGHWFTYSIADIYARYLGMNDHNVMYPIGFDAFGLPAENAAIKSGNTPNAWTEQNIKNMTKQLKSIGATFDWSQVIDTSNPDYYKWTQWIFLKLYEKGLVYRGETAVNWCPKDKTVLANEQVVNGCCERCDTPVEQRKLTQWMFKITNFADALADDLKDLDWPEDIKAAQVNWIGRSEGSLIKFKIKSLGPKIEDIEVFTTRPDTIYGATFVVISPELAQKWIDAGWKASDEVNKYVTKSLPKRELERQETKDKTGVDTDIKVSNPANNKGIPVWVADYVLGGYGTGAIMAVPAHDERDLEFAKKFNLEISDAPLEDSHKVIKLLEEKNLGQKETNYRLRDWVLSRQRYWGAPIPMVNCEKCGYQPVSEEDLPVKLPKLDDFLPVEGGKSPLARAEKWTKVKCPNCTGPAERETDTMDTFVDSSWYFIRYTDPTNKKEFAHKTNISEWLPVPLYIGGREHNTMHLLYARFITKALNRLGLVDFSEPFFSRRNHGVIMGPDGKRMSKSRGNVVDPDKEVAKYGADTVRMNFAFLGPFEQDYAWNSNNISGISRFLNRVWNFVGDFEEPKKTDEEAERIINKHTKEIGDNIKELKFNTGISGLMKLLNATEDKWLTAKQYGVFIKLLAPFAPHLAEEIWMEVLGHKESIHLEKWPEYDEKYLQEEMVDLVVQINGKTRDVLKVKRDMEEEKVKAVALASEKIKRHLEGKLVKKNIFISNRLINFIV